MTDQPSTVCIKYGITVFAIAFTVGSAFLLLQPVGTSWYAAIPVFFAVSLVMSGLMIIFRSLTYGSTNTLTPFELGAASLSGLGLSFLVALIGIFLEGIIRTEYSGTDKWLSKTTIPEKEIQRLNAELELSEETYSFAFDLLEEVMDKDLLKGRRVDEVVPAIIYISARENKEPRTLDEIAAVSSATKKEIGNAYRFIGRNTDIRVMPPEAADYIERFADQLELSDSVKRTAEELIGDASDINITSGKSPRGLAATALFLAAYQEEERRSMNEISDVLNLTTITIRERAKEFVRELGIDDFPEHLKEGMEEYDTE